MERIEKLKNIILREGVNNVRLKDEKEFVHIPYKVLIKYGIYDSIEECMDRVEEDVVSAASLIRLKFQSGGDIEYEFGVICATFSFEYVKLQINLAVFDAVFNEAFSNES